MKSIRTLTVFVMMVFVMMVFALSTFANAEENIENVQEPSFIFTPGDGNMKITGNTNKKIYILMETPDSNKIWYDPIFDENGINNQIWLVYGKGEYRISILEQVDDNVYKYFKTSTIFNDVELDKDLSPSNYINSDNSQIVDLSKSITEGCVTEMEKAKNIYDWVSTNIRYDLGKYSKMLKNDYSDQFGALVALSTGKGVCFDYSSLYAALARASGIRCKVIAGNYSTPNKSIYHAWNQFYDPSSSRWVSLDTTMGYIYNNSYFDNLDFINNYTFLEEKN